MRVRKLLIAVLIMSVVSAPACSWIRKLFPTPQEEVTGDPANSALLVVSTGHMTWIEERTLKMDKRHSLGIIECVVEPVDGGSVLVDEAYLDVLGAGGRIFVFSNLPAGTYRLRMLGAEHEVRAPDPNVAGSGEYRTIKYWFPADEFPQLSVELEIGKVEYLRLATFQVNHSSYDSEITLTHQLKDAKFLFDREYEEEALKAVADGDSESLWSAILRARVKEVAAHRRAN